jgi:hypothetical protein
MSRLSALIAALSFAVQILAFVLSPNGRVAFATGAAGAALAMSGEFCMAPDSHGGGRPDRPAAHHHCAFCPIGDRDAGLVGACVVPAVLGPLPAMAVGSAPFFADAPRRRPPGWTSSWSSRAPPVLS